MMADTNAANQVAALIGEDEAGRQSPLLYEALAVLTKRSRHRGGEGQAANAAPGFRSVNDHAHARDPLGGLGKGDDALVKVDVLPPQAKNLP